MSKAKTVKLKVLKAFGDHKIGQIVSVPCDDNGVPLAKFWKNRFHDAQLHLPQKDREAKDSRADACIEIYKEEKPAKEDKAAASGDK